MLLTLSNKLSIISSSPSGDSTFCICFLFTGSEFVLKVKHIMGVCVCYCVHVCVCEINLPA